jgi:hypothetical protein
LNVITLWQYSHDALLGGLDTSDWERKICPRWTLRDAIINLTTMEYVLIEVLESIIFGTDTPMVDRFVADYERFAEDEIIQRRNLSGAEVLEEYRYAYALSSYLLSHVPSEQWRQPGTVPWYGPDFSLEDFVVLFLFEHKRDYIAHIMKANHEHEPAN